MQNHSIVCDAKHTRYNFLIDFFDCKNNRSIAFLDMIKYIKNNSDDLFSGYDIEGIDDCFIEISNALFLVVFCKWKPMNYAISVANKIRDKFYCDVTLTMTDDDGCNQYYFLKGSQGIKTKKLK